MSTPSNTTLICEFIATNGPCATSDLKKRFGRDRTKARFILTLSGMSGRGQIDNIAPRGKEGLWALSTAAPVAEAQAQATPEKWVGQKVPPRQYDVMRAPDWVPPAMTTPRPGADAHSEFKSRGHRC